MTLIQFDEDTKPTIQRDRWGRPLITPPNGGKAVPYTRASTLAKALDDNQGLIDWSTCAGIVGAFKRAGLAASWQALIAEHGDPWYSSAESKKRAKELVRQCKEAGGSSDRADLGTALHSLTELVDRGKTLEHVQPNLAADVEAYQRTMAASGFEVLTDYMEAFVVVDELRVAGSFDLLVRLPDGRTVVADKKTGSSLDYSWLAFATQLACYSRGSLYDPATNTRTPLPNVDQASGLIIHIPAGTGTCTLHEVDLEAGWEAAQLSVEVRKWRSRKGLGRAWLSATSATPSETTSSSDGRRERAAKSTRSGSARSHSSAATTAASETPPTECTASTATAPNTSSPSSDGETSTPATSSTSADDNERRQLADRLATVRKNKKAYDFALAQWSARDLPPWPECGPAQYQAVAEMLDVVEREFQFPFDPEPQPSRPDIDEPPVRTMPEEGATYGKDAYDEFRLGPLQDASEPARKTFFWVLDEMARASKPLNLGQQTTERRLRIAHAVLEMATALPYSVNSAGELDRDRWESDEAPWRSALALVLGDDAVQPAFTVGKVIATLTIDEAWQLEQIAVGIANGSVEEVPDGSGRLRRVA